MRAPLIMKLIVQQVHDYHACHWSFTAPYSHSLVHVHVLAIAQQARLGFRAASRPSLTKPAAWSRVACPGVRRHGRTAANGQRCSRQGQGPWPRLARRPGASARSVARAPSFRLANTTIGWLPAGAMSDLPRWHTQRCVRTLPKLPLPLRPETRPTS